VKPDDKHITFLTGEEVGTWLKAQPGVMAFRYRPNTISNWFLFALFGGGLFAAWKLFRASFDSALLQNLLLALALLIALTGLWTLVHVTLFTVRAYVALSETGLLYGRGPRAFVVPRALLNREHIRWERIRVAPMWMRLPVILHDWNATIPLLNPLFHVRDLSTLIAGMLQIMMPQNEDEAAPADSGKL
jgi:hypothetical protein